jgi:HD superfamily phosphodiesterase
MMARRKVVLLTSILSPRGGEANVALRAALFHDF